MTRRGRVTWRTRFGSVMRGLAVPAVLLCAIGSANAQTSAPVDDGRAAPKETPNTGTATTEAPKTEAPKAETPKAEPPKAETPPEPQAQGTSSTPDGFKIGGFVFKPGGRIKLDIIRDFNPITSEDSFDPRTIPTDGSEGGNSQPPARETRLFLDIRGPVEGKELKMYIETDFYGSGNVLRLRQAYGSWGGLLAGQTWSTFVDESNFPNTIDFESPMAFPWIRQAQLRWTQQAERERVVVGGSRGQQVDDHVTHGRTRQSRSTRCRTWSGISVSAGSRGHAFVSGFVGKGRFRPTEGNPDNVTLWGLEPVREAEDVWA